MKLTFTLCCKPSYQPKLLQKGNAENVEVNVRNNYDVSGGSTLSLRRIHLKQAIARMSVLMSSSQVQLKMSRLSCPNLLFCFFCQQVYNTNSSNLRYITVKIMIYACPNRRALCSVPPRIFQLLYAVHAFPHQCMKNQWGALS